MKLTIEIETFRLQWMSSTRIPDLLSPSPVVLMRYYSSLSKIRIILMFQMDLKKIKNQKPPNLPMLVFAALIQKNREI